MKKIFLISLIFVLIILVVPNYVSATTISITEDNFKERFNKVMNDTNDVLSVLDKENDTITMKSNNAVVKYDFNDNPKFTLNLKFESSMNKEQCVRQHERQQLLSRMFATVGDYYNIDKYKSFVYYASKFTSENNGDKIANPPSEFTLNFTNAIDYAKQYFDKDVNIQDELFTFSCKKTNETPTSYELELVLITNINADFVQTISNDSNSVQNSITNGASNAIDNYEKDNANEEKALEYAQKWMDNYNPSETTSTSSKQSTSKNNSLPQTGTNIISFIAIILLAIISILLSIYNYRNKDIK